MPEHEPTIKNPDNMHYFLYSAFLDTLGLNPWREIPIKLVEGYESCGYIVDSIGF